MTAFETPALGVIDDRADLLQQVGRALEADPTDWMPLWDDDVMRAVCLLEVPDPWNLMPDGGGFFGPGPVTYEMQLAIAERVARHDPSCVLAMPTPTMSGHAIAILGNAEQKEAYFSRYLGPPARSFFAITEPSVGTDATAGETAIDETGHRMKVRKRLVGGAPQADCGLIFAFDAASKVHRLVFMDSASMQHLAIERLAMNGLAGADLSAITGDAVPVRPDMILGHGIQRGLRDGFFAMNGVFARYRPMIAALAAGNGRGILATLSAAGADPAPINALMIRHAVILHMLSRSAAQYEAGLARAQDTSVLKLEAIDFLEACVALAMRTLPPGDLFAVPGLLKLCRDARAWEYMEGTSNIHAMQAFRAVEAEIMQ